MRKFFVGMVMAAVATIGFGSVAFASAGTYNPPAQASCDGQVHGAFAAFGPTTYQWIPADAQEDPGLGASGPANSDAAAACNQ